MATTSRNLVNLESVTKGFGTRTLLDGVSLGVAAGDRIGVVGHNGGGKSTLLAVLTGTEPADAGRVTRTGGLRVAALPQTVTLPAGATARDVVLGTMAEHEWAGDARVREVLDGLGLARVGLDTVVDPLSGGEKRRVALAALLIGDHDLLVLDEPTNHLDIEGIAWLAGHLSALPQGVAVLAVTHDRWFLDEVATTTWDVDDGAVHAYDGGYSAYVLARAERARATATMEAKRQNLIRKELAWLRRGPPARTAKPRFRIDAANALIADEPPARDGVALRTFATARLGKTVYDVEDATLRVGQRTLLDQVTWRLGPGDRVGVVGVNGAGKTTLLRLLIGQVEPAAGQVVRGRTIKPAYLSQETTADQLDPNARVLTSVEEIARRVDLGKGREVSASQLLDQFGFRGPRQWSRTGELSGGERRRLQLLRLLLGEPNVLLLDEPTNDLDIETLNALEDLLDDWPGTLVVVSHDRYFLERTCDRTLALLGDGRLTDLPGGIEEYVRKRAAFPGAASVTRTAAPTAGGGNGNGNGQAAPIDAKAVREARKALVRLERQIDRLDRREAELHAELAAKASDYTELTRIDAELRALRAEKAEAEDAWLALSETA